MSQNKKIKAITSNICSIKHTNYITENIYNMINITHITYNICSIKQINHMTCKSDMPGRSFLQQISFYSSGSLDVTTSSQPIYIISLYNTRSCEAYHTLNMKL